MVAWDRRLGSQIPTNRACRRNLGSAEVIVAAQAALVFVLLEVLRVLVNLLGSGAQWRCCCCVARYGKVRTQVRIAQVNRRGGRRYRRRFIVRQVPYVNI